jgi:hypothetical protein
MLIHTRAQFRFACGLEDLNGTFAKLIGLLQLRTHDHPVQGVVIGDENTQSQW